MRFIGNVIWFVFGGLLTSTLWFLIGLLLCVTVVGIPFGLQCIKIAQFVIWPFGKEIDLGYFGFSGFIGNIIWIVLIGWELALAHLSSALFTAITIIGIPFAIQHVKFAKLALIPFGAKIVEN